MLSQARLARASPESNARKNVTTCLFLFIYNLFVYYPLFLILLVLVEALSGADSGLSLIDFFFQRSGNLSLYTAWVFCSRV